jgi:tripartite ATP-independent transporter DctM subunit
MTTVMLVILALWFVCLFTGAPIYVTMALAAAAFVFAAGINPVVVAQRLAKGADSFPLLAAPMYILMGSLMNSAGVTERIFRFATVCVGWWKGGLCHANILGSVIFAGMSGSAVADAGGIGTIEIKAMRDAGYDAETAAAITAASATIGPIIPPSLPMIIYGVAAEASIGDLFLGGVVPGLLMAAALMVMVRAIAIRKNLPGAPFPGLREVAHAFGRVLGADVPRRTVRRHAERGLHRHRVGGRGSAVCAAGGPVLYDIFRCATCRASWSTRWRPPA